jgi:hypothetical protein
VENFTKESRYKCEGGDMGFVRDFRPFNNPHESNLMGSVMKTMDVEFEGACVRFLLSCSIIWM